jgi:hypothetical protein
MHYLERLKVEAIVSERSGEALRSAALLARLRPGSGISERLAALCAQLNAASAQIAAVRAETGHLMPASIVRQSQKLAKLRRRHDDDLDQFQERWNDPEKPSTSAIASELPPTSDKWFSQQSQI